MAAHPVLGAADSPDGEALANAESGGEKHEAEADDAVEDAERCAASDPGGEQRIRDVNQEQECREAGSFR